MATALAPSPLSTKSQFLRTIDDEQDFKKLLLRHGYYTSSADLICQLWLAIHDMQLTKKAISALLLDGPPGVGKTFAAQVLAKLLEAEFLSMQFTVGVGREVLMHDIDIAAVVSKQVEAAVVHAGGTDFTIDPESLIIPGVLQVALEMSLKGKVVLLLDELDKAKPYVDSMLLEFLQECAIAHPTQRGRILRGNPNNLLVMMTKNNERGLTEPLMRRCRSVYMAWPEADTEMVIVKKLALAHLDGTPFRGEIDKLVTFIVHKAQHVRRAELTLRKVPSSPELANAIVDAIRVPLEHRGKVICRALFKYREDYQDYNKANAGTEFEVTEKLVTAQLPRF